MYKRRGVSLPPLPPWRTVEMSGTPWRGRGADRRVQPRSPSMYTTSNIAVHFIAPAAATCLKEGRLLTPPPSPFPLLYCPPFHHYLAPLPLTRLTSMLPARLLTPLPTSPLSLQPDPAPGDALATTAPAAGAAGEAAGEAPPDAAELSGFVQSLLTQMVRARPGISAEAAVAVFSRWFSPGPSKSSRCGPHQTKHIYEKSCCNMTLGSRMSCAICKLSSFLRHASRPYVYLICNPPAGHRGTETLAHGGPRPWGGLPKLLQQLAQSLLQQLASCWA